MAHITILGLGPGDFSLLTLRVHTLLQETSELWLRTRHHPVVEALPSHIHLASFDDLYEQASDFATLYETIAHRVLDLGRRPEGVVYAVPGHPWVGELTVRLITQRAAEEHIPVHIEHGLSFIEPTLAALQVDALDNIQLCDATTFAARYAPPFEPDRPALIAQVYNRLVASEVKVLLLDVYPADHPVTLVDAAGTTHETVVTMPLYQLDHREDWALLSSLYVPPLSKPASMTALMDVVAHLRAPDGCPWDREQDHQTLRPYLLEEAYEVLEALDNDDAHALREELGDLLLQVALHAQIAAEYGEFTMADVLAGLIEKLIYRHPHVFGDRTVNSSQEVLQNWEALKQQEKVARGETNTAADPFEGVPVALPALAKAQKIVKRLRALGYNVPSPDEAWRAWQSTPDAATLGTLLLALAAHARDQHIDAETALRETLAHWMQKARQS